MTIRLYARRKQWPLERVRLKVTHHRDGLQAKDRFVREIELVGPVRHQRSLDRTGGLKNLAYNIRRLVTLERLAAA
jgi:hypothetical protein